MKISTLLLIVCAIGCATHFHELVEKLTPSGDKARWLEDEEQALADARADNRFVLLHFTGSDWCGVCKALDKEVLSTDEFKEIADDNFVLVDVDYPHRKSQSAKVRAQNAALGQQYGIRGVPTVVVLNSNGVEVGKIGYQPGAPEDFLAELKRFRRVAGVP